MMAEKIKQQQQEMYHEYALQQEKLNAKLEQPESKKLTAAEKKKAKEELKKAKKKKTKQSKSEKRNSLIFAQSDDSVPLFLINCIQFIEQNLDSEGLYRVPGNRCHVDYLFEKFNEGNWQLFSFSNGFAASSDSREDDFMIPSNN